MSSIVETIVAELGSGTLSKVGASLGLEPAQMQSVVSAALPAFVSQLASNAANPDGAQALASALDQNHGPSLLDHLGPLAGQLLGGSGGNAGGLDLGSLLGAASTMFGGSDEPSAPAGASAAFSLPAGLDGAGILGHVFGGKLSGVIAQIVKLTGLSSAKILSILTALGPIVMSALGTLKSKFGLDAGKVASLLSTDAEQLGGPAERAEGLDLGALGSMLSSSGLLGGLFASPS